MAKRKSRRLKTASGKHAYVSFKTSSGKSRRFLAEDKPKKSKSGGSRKMTAYTKFMQKHLKAGKTMAQAAALWRKHKA
jgi:hypothetical protein